MTGEQDHAAVADAILARQAARRERANAIMASPAAKGRESIAFALACRTEIPAARAIAAMAEAPELHGVDAIIAWVDAIPPRPPLEVVR